MILSVSRRTDIPAFYSNWFFDKIEQGFLLARNPMNAKQVSRISLAPSLVDCIVFWTKNPKPMMKKLHLLEKYTYYFQFTLNSYDKSIEPNVPNKKYLINTFIDLSRKLGRKRVVWRYDPVLITERFSKEYHYKWFEYLAQRLHSYTEKCVISFLDPYRKTRRSLRELNPHPLGEVEMYELSGNLANIASRYGLAIETCSESCNLQDLNIQHGKCIDDLLISRLIRKRLEIAKDPNQRDLCGCVKSIDIGEYNTCKHHCLYCYANFSRDMVTKNCSLHNFKSPLLIGHLSKEAKVTERFMESYRKGS